MEEKEGEFEPYSLGELERERSVSIEVGSKRVDVPVSSGLCILCCNDLSYVAIGQCNHKLFCFLCALRLRIIMNDKNCPICKVFLVYIVRIDFITLERAYHYFYYRSKRTYI
jgi:hypothetical protein